jgi:ribosomal protein RSM22 (predicted rRNA methylase)
MDHMPVALQRAIFAMIAQDQTAVRDLQTAADHLSDVYCKQHFSQAFEDSRRILSYLAVRLPAIYGVVARILHTIPEDHIRTLVDVGAGPATALWAAQERFKHLRKAVLFERHPGMRVVGQRLAKELAHPSLQVEWCPQHVEHVQDLGTADLVILSYALGEIDFSHYERLMTAIYKAAGQFIVLIEPGTPHGFQAIKIARQALIALGGKVVAPCTHDRACPLVAGDWCHFSERIARSDLHRVVKRGDLAYEDEKYSYVIIAKGQHFRHKSARVIKMPLRRTGHVLLDLCDETGLHKVTYSRKDSTLYRNARKVRWGNLWPDKQPGEAG